MADSRPAQADAPQDDPPRRQPVRPFLVKVAAVTAAALVVLYAAKSWLRPSERRIADGGVVPWHEAAKHIGQYVTVQGQIVETRNTGKACFLNFHPDWRHTFTAVLFANRFGAFPPKPEEHYRGKTVRVSGVVREYEGKPEIILESPDQIVIVR